MGLVLATNFFYFKFFGLAVYGPVLHVLYITTAQCTVYEVFVRPTVRSLQHCGGVCVSPSLVGLGQHFPPAVSQQYPHVSDLLQSRGQSPHTKYIVICEGGCMGGDGRSEGQDERREGRRKREGEEEREERKGGGRGGKRRKEGKEERGWEKRKRRGKGERGSEKMSVQKHVVVLYGVILKKVPVCRRDEGEGWEKGVRGRGEREGWEGEVERGGKEKGRGRSQGGGGVILLYGECSNSEKGVRWHFHGIN